MARKGSLRSVPNMGLPAVAIGGTAATPEQHVFANLLRWQRTLDVTGRCNANTRRQYRNVVFSYLATLSADPGWQGSRDALGVNRGDLVAYLDSVPQKGGYRNQAIKALRSWHRFLLEEEVIGTDPAATIRPQRRRARGRPPNISDEDLEAVFAAAEQIDPRARPGLELTFHTGARLGSVVAALPEHLHLDDPDGPWVHWAVAKNDDPYDSPLNEVAVGACEQLLTLIDWKPPTAASRRPTLVGVGEARFSDWVRWAGQRSGVKTWTHLLRHAFCYRVANDPAIPAMVAADLMNHKDTSLLRAYAAGDRELARLAVAHIARRG